jgi:phytoene dehydrogenase-like protein
MWFMRPAIGWANYRTPIDGYYQCGSGTHPGGCVMGAPGKLAAAAVLKDREKAVATRSGRGAGVLAAAPG